MASSSRTHEAFSSSSSSSSSKPSKYDVFLSFRGADTRKSFVDHFYMALKASGINAFIDENELRRGENVSAELVQAIQGSNIAVIVFSRRYGDSSWCLEELVKIMECRTTLGQTVLPIFYDVDPSDVRKQTGSFGEAFHQKHKDVDKDMVQRWRSTLTEAANLSGWGFRTTADGNEAKFILKIIDEKIIKKITGKNLLSRNNADQGCSAEWAFLIIALFLEILSIAFDQAATPNKPHYALYGMLLAIGALLICTSELIYKGIKERVELKRWGMLWWFYHPPPRYTIFGTLPDMYGLIGGISQCVCSTVQYVYFSRHADNPIKVSLWPAIFLICLGASRLSEKQKVHAP